MPKKIGKTFLSMIVSSNDIDICEIPDKLDQNNFIFILNKKIKKI